MNTDQHNARGSGAARMPVAFVPHGGGPWPFVEMGLDKAELGRLAAYLRTVATLPPVVPKALLVVSAHWEADVPTVMTAAQPPMLYDYYGFPKAAYALTWPAPGAPTLAARVQALLEARDIPVAADAARGFDHGTFVPLKVAYPRAEIPTVQVSLQAGLDPTQHIAIGRALAPLRDEGVFIIGSGMSFHNMRGFGKTTGAQASETFGAWLDQAMAWPAEKRRAALCAWENAPAARAAHPREEHLLPLMVVVGAAGDDPAAVAFSDTVMGVRVSAYHFG